MQGSAEIDDRAQSNAAVIATIDALLGKSDKTDLDNARLTSLTAMLDENMGGIGLEYNEKTGKLNQSISDLTTLNSSSAGGSQFMLNYEKMQEAVANGQALEQALSGSDESISIAKRKWDEALTEYQQNWWNLFNTEPADNLRAASEDYDMQVREQAKSQAELEENKKLQEKLAAEMADYLKVQEQLTGKSQTLVNTFAALNSGEMNHYASGTANAAAGMAIVGENGPETVLFRGGETVLPAGRSAGAGDINVTYSPQYRIDGAASEGLLSILRQHDEEFKIFITNIMQEISADYQRRVYN